MNLFQNSNSNTWRGQNDFRSDPYPESAAPQNNPDPYADSTDTRDRSRSDAPAWQNGAGTNNMNQQDSRHPDSADSRNIPHPNGSGQNWMENPALAGIDPARLQMLSSLASQAQSKNQNELLPFLMAAASGKNTDSVSFRPDEIDTIINVMKIGKSPQEIQQIERICALMRQFDAIRGKKRKY